MKEPHEHYRRHNFFLGSREDPEEARIILFGAPMDWSTSFRPGTRFGPGHIRYCSEGLEEYSPYLDRELREVSFYDAGDITLSFGDVEGSLARIKETARHVVGGGKIPFVLGGEHLISYPVVAAVREKYPELVVLHFDAHTDLREEFFAARLSHATVMRLIHYLGGIELYQFGIRSGEREEFLWAEKNAHFYPLISPPYAFLEPLQEVAAAIKGKPVYVSLDIDVVDPAFAPGTGTPEPGGCTAQEILQAIHLLREQRVVGFDLVEVAPHLDHAEITGVLAAKLVREALLAWG